MNEQGRCFCFAEKKQYSEYVGEDALSTPAVTFLDHPRVCGEKSPHIGGSRFKPGSPPPVRGKGASGIVCDFVHGITPTCAGKSPAIMVCSLEYWGSPPRVWGKVQPERDVQDAARITPAYAGKSQRGSSSSRSSWDHPRVCGEKFRLRCVSSLSVGSPPRMRGKGGEGVERAAFVGITPAYAGKRIAELQTPAVSWDHPRVCGEKVPITCVPKYALGSPPRMRGKEKYSATKKHGPRITPAYAGKSYKVMGNGSCSQDHPRVCGEKFSGARLCNRCMGSPPRMRGKAFLRQRRKFAVGITPAYAGKRGTPQRMQRRNTGSPPRMRGKGAKRLPPCEFGRITPAYAGKSFYRNGGRMGR